MDEQDSKAIGRMEVAAADAKARVLGDPVLSRSPLVRALSEGSAEILAQSRLGRLSNGGILFRSGQAAATVILVVDGSLSVHAEASPESAVALTVPVGEVVGAAAALGEETRRVTVTASHLALVVEMPSAPLAAVADANPAVRVLLEEARDRDRGAAGDMADFLDRW
jgi:CRP-like cAMP-binding protein